MSLSKYLSIGLSITIGWFRQGVNFPDFYSSSPEAAFTSSVYFLHNEFANFSYTANFKDIFGGTSSECVRQQAITCCSCYRMPQNALFLRTRDLLVSQKTTQRHFFFHPTSPFPSNFCNCISGGICIASQF